MWTLFVLNFDATYCNTLPNCLGVQPLVYLIPKDKVEDVKKYAKESQKYWWDNDDDDLEIDECFEKYLSDNHIDFRVIGTIDIPYGKRKMNYLDENIPTECI